MVKGGDERLATGELGASYYEIHFKEKLKIPRMYVLRLIFSNIFQNRRMKCVLSGAIKDLFR